MNETNETAFQIYLLLVTLGVAMTWEFIRPRRAEAPSLGFRWANNFSLAFVNQLIMQAMYALGLVAMASLARDLGWGLFQDASLPWFVMFLVSVLAFDLVGYLLHIVQHKVQWLWRFHCVHHSDTGLDCSSSFRHHPLEAILGYVATLPVLLIFSPPVTVVIAYGALQICAAIWGHANIYLPERADRVLRLFLVTPDFHRLHHCSERRHTDSNYGAITPWFDYLFRTYRTRPFSEQQTMQLGLERFRELGDSRLDRLLLMPFRHSNWQTQPCAPSLEQNQAENGPP